MPNSIGRGIEWCDCLYLLPGGYGVCSVDNYWRYPETKCPDLGDWSDTPHDELDHLSWHNFEGQLVIGIDWSLDCKYHPINVDRERLLSYIED